MLGPVDCPDSTFTYQSEDLIAILDDASDNELPFFFVEGLDSEEALVRIRLDRLYKLDPVLLRFFLTALSSHERVRLEGMTSSKLACLSIIPKSG
ncbi:MAG: hypothetical protein AB7M93_29790 [Candidatus Obscuribacterales bacterium]